MLVRPLKEMPSLFTVKLKCGILGASNKASNMCTEPKHGEKTSLLIALEALDRAVPENLQLDLSVTCSTKKFVLFSRAI